MATVKKPLKAAGKKRQSAAKKQQKSSPQERPDALDTLSSGSDAAKAGRPRRKVRDDAGDDLPPEDAEVDVESLDADLLVAEVERQESKGSEEDAESALPEAPLPAFAADDDDALADADAVLPSMEGMSILRETELNDVINDVKRRSEANGGYVTYEELNQILPQNIVDAIPTAT